MIGALFLGTVAGALVAGTMLIMGAGLLTALLAYSATGVLIMAATMAMQMLAQWRPGEIAEPSSRQTRDLAQWLADDDQRPLPPENFDTSENPEAERAGRTA